MSLSEIWTSWTIQGQSIDRDNLHIIVFSSGGWGWGGDMPCMSNIFLWHCVPPPLICNICSFVFNPTIINFDFPVLLNLGKSASLSFPGSLTSAQMVRVSVTEMQKRANNQKSRQKICNNIWGGICAFVGWFLWNICLNNRFRSSGELFCFVLVW